MEIKEKVNDIIEDVNEVVDAAEDVLDAAEDVGERAGGLLTRIKQIIISIIAYFKNLFKKEG